MKRCNACKQDFEDQFVFCPVDATPLRVSTARTTQAELQLTIIDNAGLLERLARELRFQFKELQRSWPELKRDPVAFAKQTCVATGRRLRQSLLAPNSIAAISTAFLILFTVVLTIALLDRRSQKNLITDNILEQVQMLEFSPDATPSSKDEGDGVGSQGRVGLRSGKGEGSGAVPRKSTGGGGGGDHSKEPKQVGAVPPPSNIPAAIPTLPPVKNAALPVAGINIDPALWQAMSLPVYGDPRSKSSTPANGSRDGGGMGTGNGTGIGEGNGPGFGPGQVGNIGDGRNGPGCCGPGGGRGHNPNPDDPDHVYPQAQVTERVRVIAKPEPQYSEEARRNLVMGTVVLRVVFSRTGEITNIRAVQTLPFGLTERAIAAARLIRFHPATRMGQPVSVSMQLEYNFNLY
jgi:TonB family protein